MSDQHVVLVPSRYSEWTAMAADMSARLRIQLVGAHLEHIGSTSVPDLASKDVVDLLIGVDKNRVEEVAEELAAAGFDLEGGVAGHCWLSYPAREERRYILHIVEFDGVPWRRRIAFRDLLRRDGHARARYQEAKRAAAQQAAGWDDYTQSKTPVVAGLLAEAAASTA